MSMTLLQLRLSQETISMLDVVVVEIHDYCNEHKMKLNPKKCKEMYINFLKKIRLLQCDLKVFEIKK